MGDISYDDATEGRLHLSGAGFGSFNYELRDPRSATMEGVGLEKLRNYNLNRKLEDIHCPRTITVMTTWGLAGIGVDPSGGSSLASGDGSMSMTRAKWAMANFYHEREIDHDDMGWLEGDHEQDLVDDGWSDGVHKIWNQLKGKTLAEMGITSVGN
jgi:hypothetical protein